MTGASDSAHHRRRRWIVVLVVSGLIVTVAAVFVAFWRRSGAHQVSTEEVRRRFEQDASSTQPPSPTVLRPAAGVYVYRGSGTEDLSLPPKSQRQGPEMPATVTHRADGCWTFRIDYSSQHWQTWMYCPRNGGLVELGGQTFERWDFVFTTYDSTSTFTCDPPLDAIRPEMQPGDHWEQTCHGTSSGTTGEAVSSGPYMFVGDDVVTVEKTAVPAYHFRQQRTLTGNQTGTQTADLWFAKKDGLPLRNDRDVSVRTDTVVGSSTYTEHGSFELTSLRTATLSGFIRRSAACSGCPSSAGGARSARARRPRRSDRCRP